MKKSIKFLFATVSIFLLLQGCGDRGPVGPEGPPGPEILPTSFEFTIDLLEQNNFEWFEEIPGQIEVLNSDVILAFVLEDYDEDADLEIWRKLPITEFNNNGTLLFDYDFTLIDVRIFLDANYTLSSADEFDNVLIRAVHVPSNYVQNSKSKSSVQQSDTFHELEQRLGVKIQRLK